MHRARVAAERAVRQGRAGNSRSRRVVEGSLTAHDGPPLMAARDGARLSKCNRPAVARWTPLRHTCVDMPAEARVCAYAVLRRVFEDGAYADRALHGEAKRARRARPRAGDAPRLWRGAAQGHARPPDRASRRPPCGAAGRARCWRLCGWGCMSCCTSAARPTTRSWRTRWSWPRAARAAGTGWSMRCCAAPRARARACWRSSTMRRREQAAVKHSHPEWIARLWWEELGASDARALMAVRQRAGRGRAAREHAAHRRRDARRASSRWRPAPIPHLPEALVLEEPFDAHDSPAWRAGAFLAQSRAAMLVSAGARAAAGRAGARPVRRAGRQEHAPRGADGRRRARSWRSSATRAGRACSRAPRSAARRQRPRRGRRRRQLQRPRGSRVDRVLVDPRARVWARCRRAPTCAGV